VVVDIPKDVQSVQLVPLVLLREGLVPRDSEPVCLFELRERLNQAERLPSSFVV
jgi:hypothetical protein